MLITTAGISLVQSVLSTLAEPSSCCSSVPLVYDGFSFCFWHKLTNPFLKYLLQLRPRCSLLCSCLGVEFSRGETSISDISAAFGNQLAANLYINQSCAVI